MSDNTPSMEQVREAWAEMSGWDMSLDESDAAFARFVEAVRAEERERIARNIEAMPGATRSYIAGRPGAFVTRDRAAWIAREGA